ncbi:hypothetical protein QYM36_006435 [Artemia franciscana]|uniref:RNA polymerase II-associated protein 1 n=1 Tax=Artemia franciscana TaxID=6661 RepID=A0AA88L9X4_ARTSF|nr:hypothetical protein QYM36_006435 [Artemia franciscana]
MDSPGKEIMDEDTDEAVLEMQRRFFSERKDTSDVKIKKSVKSQAEAAQILEALESTAHTVDKVLRTEKDFETLENDDFWLIGTIKERPAPFVLEPKAVIEKQPAFPEAFSRDKLIEQKSGKKKESLFALNMKKKRGIVEDSEPMEVEEVKIEGLLPSTFISSSGIFTSKEAEEISQKNAEKLSAMTQAEILEEQEKLLSQLDPKVVDFLKKGRQPSAGKKRNTEEEDKKSVKFSKFDDIKEISEEDLPIRPSESWVNMDKVELDKLQWMTQLPPPRPLDPNTGHSARFNFKGELVAPDMEVPVTKGLHHHGEEPERAGYSIEELFTLIRSTSWRQKVLAMDTLAAILRKNKEGIFDGIFDQTLLKELLDGGLLVLLRINLDEQNDSVISSSLIALSALLSNQPDELCLDRVVTWQRGIEQPSLPTSIDIEETSKKHFTEEGEELKDVEILQIDVVRACFRMNLLERLRYILNNFELHALSVFAAIDILIRIARHSLESSTAIFECEGLLDVIFVDFLPPQRLLPDVKPKLLDKVKGVPLRQAIRLIRVIAAKGVHLAKRIVHKYPIIDSIAAYIMIEPSETVLPIQDTLRLSIEALNTWRTFLSYGLTASSCSGLFPIIMKNLMFYLSRVSLNLKTVENMFNYVHGAALLSFVETMILVAGNYERLNKLQKQHLVSVPVPDISWEIIHPLGDLVINIALKWTHELDTYFSDITDAGRTAVASVLSAVATYFKYLTKQSSCNMVQVITSAENLFERIIRRFFTSKNLDKQFDLLCVKSVIASSAVPGSKRDPPNLPSLGSVTWGGNVSPIITESSPVSVLSSLLRLAFELCQISRISVVSVQDLWKSQSVLKYLKKLTDFGFSLSDHWFAKFEVDLIYWILKLSIESQRVSLYTL